MFGPKTAIFAQKYLFLGTGRPCQLIWCPVGWWLWRAGCISRDTYLLHVVVLDIDICASQVRWSMWRKWLTAQSTPWLTKKRGIPISFLANSPFTSPSFCTNRNKIEQNQTWPQMHWTTCTCLGNLISYAIPSPSVKAYMGYWDLHVFLSTTVSPVLEMLFNFLTISSIFVNLLHYSIKSSGA